jgi:hypothetical protein
MVTPHSDQEVPVNVSVLIYKKYLVVIRMKIYRCWTTLVVLEVRYRA